MRQRLLAAIVAALIVTPTSDLACELVCRSKAGDASDTQRLQDSHAHHHAAAGPGGATLQAAPHGCDHGAQSTLVAATPIKSGGAIAVTPGAPASRLVAMVGAAIPWSGTTQDRAAPPGITTPLPYLRI